MAFQKRGQQDKAYVADYVADLKNVPAGNMGSTCWVIETAEKYMANSKGEWVLQTLSTNGNGTGGGGASGDPGDYVTVGEFNRVISDMKNIDKEIVAQSNAQDEALLDRIDDLNEESTIWNTLAE